MPIQAARGKVICVSDIQKRGGRKGGTEYELLINKLGPQTSSYDLIANR